MKKILVALLLCALLIVMPLSVSAEEIAPNEGEITTEGDNNTPENETPTEGENSGDEDYEIGDVFEGEIPGVTPDEVPEETPDETPEETPSDPVPDETPVETPIETPTEDIKEKNDVKAITAEIAKWLEDNYEWLSLVITIIGYGILMIRKLSLVRKSMGTINNNAITIANNSKSAIDEARASIESASGKVTSYEERIAALLEAYKNTAEDKVRLENEFLEIRKYLETSTQANMEFANELAELLALANIPNYKKEEIGARHLAAKRHIEEAAAKAVALLPVSSEEVKVDDGEEA